MLKAQLRCTMPVLLRSCAVSCRSTACGHLSQLPIRWQCGAAARNVQHTYRATCTFFNLQRLMRKAAGASLKAVAGPPPAAPAAGDEGGQ